MWDVARLPLKAKLALLLSVFLSGFAAFFALSYWTLGTVRIGSEAYGRIIQSKDLVADILPPPEYIIESYLLTLQALDETDPAALRELASRGDKLRAEYEKRHDYWSETLGQGQIRRDMIQHSYEPAIRFYELRDREIMPALLRGERERAEALARGPLREQYEAHRRVIDRIVAAALADQTAQEQSSATLVRQATNWLIGLAGAIAAVALFLSMRILGTLLARLRGSSVALSSTATQIAATSREQQATVSGYSASTTQIAASVREISATSQELLRTMDEIESVAQRARDAATDGRSGLSDMDATMQALSTSTGSISSKLSAIREKAHDINMVVTTITKVADQTNLLSVNAAIEAEKAGEYGLGFLVVAREIRRLADQSAVSTLDIEQMVRHMQSAVSAGVMEMDRFAEDVRQSVGTVREISSQFGHILDHVQTLVERFASVTEGMRNQSEGARQISEAMAQLTEGARQTASSLKEFNAATDSLRQVVDGLREELATTTARAA
jgi:methyl-accepting chemotaxis protein WspA